MPPKTSSSAVEARIVALEEAFDRLYKILHGNGRPGLIVEFSQLASGIMTKQELAQFMKSVEDRIGDMEEGLQRGLVKEFTIALQRHQIEEHESDEAHRKMAENVLETGRNLVAASKHANSKHPESIVPDGLWKKFMALNNFMTLYPAAQLLAHALLVIFWMLGWLTIDQVKEYLSNIK